MTTSDEFEIPDSKILSNPSDPMRVAKELIPTLPQPHAFWRGDFYRHVGTHWVKVPPANINKWVWVETDLAFFTKLDAKGKQEFVRWAPTPRKVSGVLAAMGAAAGRDDDLDDDRPIAFSNGVLKSHDSQKVKPHSPEHFNLTSLPFAFDPDAICPEWWAFLDSILPFDMDSQNFLQEWFGYVLSGQTDMHKIGVIIGPPRSGKGTIARVLEAMVGPSGYVAPTIARLGGNFSLESMIGRSLAVLGDVRWTHKDMAGAVETMLTISGEDGITVPRKNRDDWIGRLGIRFMLISNDVPSFNDTSGAFANRMVFVELRKSFLGREDRGLQARLEAELPGIFNWAMQGLVRLNRNGRFTQSASVAELRQEVNHSASPILAWAEEWCVFGDHTTSLDALFQSYKEWLTDQDSAMSPNKARFSRELRSALGHKGVTVHQRKTIEGRRVHPVHGLKVRPGAQIEPSNVVQLFDAAS